MTDNRSPSALAADRTQERLIFSGRSGQLLLLMTVLAAGVGVSVWQEVQTIYIIAGIAAWMIWGIHVSFTAVLHELFELNDQIAGRKDEFRRLLGRAS